MSKEDDFQEAVMMLRAGRRQQAAQALSHLYGSIPRGALKLRVIDALVACLNQVDNANQLLDIITEAILVAHELHQPGIEAHFMVKKAELLRNHICLLKYEQQNLRLSPDWLGFATEADRNDYDRLTRQIEEARTQIDLLQQSAFQTMRNLDSKRLEGSIWMTLGQIYGMDYMDLKIDALQESPSRFRWWHRLAPLRRIGFENYLLFTPSQIWEIRKAIRRFTGAYLRSAQCFRDNKDSTEAYALFNLANNLRTAFRFRAAMKYLQRARKLAQNHNDINLLRLSEQMEQRIRERNKNIPNYIEAIRPQSRPGH